MTSAQSKKLSTIKDVIHSFENKAGDLVIDTTYGTSRFIRLFIGPRGGFSTPSIVYKEYDFENKKPHKKLFTQH